MTYIITKDNTIDYIALRFGLDLGQRSPIKITGINRTIMADVLAEIDCKVGAEIGVAQGHHARLLCEHIEGVKLYCVDVWKRYKGYNEYRDRIDRYYEEAKERLSPYDAILIRKFSADAANDFENESLDFVYIDAAHDFMNVAIDISIWSKKVRIGGVVFGHDYKRTRGKYVVDVKDVVPAFCYAKRIVPWFILQNDIRDDLFGRDNPGWMFVRSKGDRV